MDEAAANGYELQLSAPLADEDPVASYERAIRARRVDGFVLLRTAIDDSRSGIWPAAGCRLSPSANRITVRITPP